MDSGGKWMLIVVIGAWLVVGNTRIRSGTRVFRTASVGFVP